MKWEGREESQNVEDRRGLPAGGGIAIGGGLGTLVILLLYLLMGADPQELMRQVPMATQINAEQNTRHNDPKQEALRKFVGVVLKDTEDVWQEVFKTQLGRPYIEPKLVLFTGSVRSACGVAGSQVGPFYCPGDSNVYLDLQFFDELSQKLGAQGDLAMAYVVAHEVGHHVQNQLGISEQVQRAQARASELVAKELSVRTELQADFLAGVFIRHAQETKQILERGDIEEALVAANQIGDDTLQRRGGGRVSPEAFTHGSSEQRKKWLSKGIQTGDMSLLMKPFELSRQEIGL